MALLPPLEEILQEFPQLSEKKRALAEKLYVALSGEVPRDVLSNYGKPKTAETNDDFVKQFGEFMRVKVEALHQSPPAED
jgi:hypothetical protein